MTLRIWWTVWGELVRKLVALGASFASMVGLLVAFLPSMKDLPLWATSTLSIRSVLLSHPFGIGVPRLSRPSRLCQDRY